MIKELIPYSRLIISGDGADCLFAGLKPNHLAEIFLTEKERRVFFPALSRESEKDNPLSALLSQININDPIKRQVLIDLCFLARNRVDYPLCAARACGAKIILPYLERYFIDTALSIPGEYLIRRGQQKYIFRKTFEDKLPDYCGGIEKKGFSPPFSFWYNSRRDFVIKTMVKAVKLGIPEEYIKYLIRALPLSRSYEEGMKVWLLLNLVFWAEQNTDMIS
jgi:asparagine synthetase B (glutamine-hydrolysing)